MSTSKTIAIIMGSFVSADGTPGGVMRRRVGAALQLVDEISNLLYISTGGILPDRPCSEVEAMKDLLKEAGIQSQRIILESNSKNTLQNVNSDIQALHSFQLSIFMITSVTSSSGSTPL